jgi:hypothetical protein
MCCCRFADQFSVWRFAKRYNIGSHVAATLLRLPLRTKAQARISPCSPAAPWQDLALLEGQLQEFCQHAGHSMLFLRTLQAVRVSKHTEISKVQQAAASAAGTAADRTDTAVELARPPGSRAQAASGAAGAAAAQDGADTAVELARPASRAQEASGSPGISPRPQQEEYDNTCLLAVALTVSDEQQRGLTMPEPGAKEAGNKMSQALGFLFSKPKSQKPRLRLVPMELTTLQGDGSRTSTSSYMVSYSQEQPAAVAVCTAVEGHSQLLPASGLFAPLPVLPSTRDAAALGDAAPQHSHLGCQAFLVCGQLSMQHRQLPAAEPDAGMAPSVSSSRSESTSPTAFAASGGAAAAAAGSRSNSRSQSRSSGPMGRHVQPGSPAAAGSSGAYSSQVAVFALTGQLSLEDKRVLDAIAVAWEDLVMWVFNGQLHRALMLAVYDLMPHLVAAVADSDAHAVYAYRQMYAAVAKQQVWRLHSGQLANLPEGCFLEASGQQQQQQQHPVRSSIHSTALADVSRTTSWATEQDSMPDLEAGSDADEPASAVAGTAAPASVHTVQVQPHVPARSGPGPAATAFIQRHVPLFKVPWRVKLQLDAAGIAGIREVTPAVTRRLLKTLLERAGFQQQLSVLEAAELLAFCLADTIRDPEAVQHHGMSSSSSPDPLALPPQLAGLVDATASNMGNIVNSLRDTLGIPTLDFSAGTAAGPGHGAPGSNLINMQAAKECIGLPMFTARQRFLRLGRDAQLLLCPADCEALLLPPGGAAGSPIPSSPSPGSPVPSSMDSRVAPEPLLAAGPAAAELADKFLHPALAAALQQYLRLPQLRQLLGLQFLTLPRCEQLMQRAFVRAWPHTSNIAAMLGNAAAGQPVQALPWVDGSAGGPSAAQLAGLWRVLHSIREEALLWGEEEQGWEAFVAWPLMPTTAGQLVPISCAQVVFTVPKAQPTAAGAAAAGAAAAAAAAPAAAEGAAAPVAPAAMPNWAALPQPWKWLLPALQQAGCPVLDPRFDGPCRELCQVPLLDRLVDPSEPQADSSMPGLITGRALLHLLRACLLATPAVASACLSALDCDCLVTNGRLLVAVHSVTCPLLACCTHR